MVLVILIGICCLLMIIVSIICGVGAGKFYALKKNQQFINNQRKYPVVDVHVDEK